MENNEILKKYYKLFDEMPFLLTTTSYNDDNYQILMTIAINRNKPLSKKEIVDFIGKYDVVEENVVDNTNVYPFDEDGDYDFID